MFPIWLPRTPLCHSYGTLVDCLFIGPLVRLQQRLPFGRQRQGGDSMNVKWMHLCYVALGFAFAHWIFRRQLTPVVDPVARFRSSGLL